MLEFVFAAIALTLVALAFIAIPLWRMRSRTRQAVAAEASNLALARAQRDEVLRDHAAGLISDAEKEEALSGLAERLSQDLAGSAPDAAPPLQGGKATGWVAALLFITIPLASGLLYWKLGTPQALNPQTANPPAPSDQQIVAMVDALTEKMKSRPDDAQGWGLLARSQAAMGRFEASLKSYERLNQLQPNDADVLTDYAEVVAMTQGESFEGKPWELLQKALAANPDQRKALALSGSAELKRRRLAEATRHWERLLRLLPPDSDDYKQVQGALLEVKLAMGGAASAPAIASAKEAAPAKPAAATPGAVSGTVTLSPALAKSVAPGDTVFIFARAAVPDAPRMPLAVLRISASELPKRFELTDAMAMAPNVKLSDFPQVSVEARVSKSGNAQSQPGDLLGLVGPVKPGTAGINVVINRQVK